jgi:hypothetical protein
VQSPQRRPLVPGGAALAPLPLIRFCSRAWHPALFLDLLTSHNALPLEQPACLWGSKGHPLQVQLLTTSRQDSSTSDPGPSQALLAACFLILRTHSGFDRTTFLSSIPFTPRQVVFSSSQSRAFPRLLRD